MEERAIRAVYDDATITVYQAYREEIARPALAHGRFVPPFSRNRMTWIKPSFLWMMERSNWGRKPGQECVLAIRVTRAGWEEALAHAVLTSFYPSIYGDYENWQRQLEAAAVRVQWDPERTITGKSLAHKSIQVGLSRHIIGAYVDEWTVEIRDATPLVRKLHALIQSGHTDRAKELLPPERVYPLSATIARRLGMTVSLTGV
jgi:uncharacterized protein DUF4291